MLIYPKRLFATFISKQFNPSMVLSFLMKGLLGIAACYVWGFTSIRRGSWIVVLAKIHPEQNLTVQRLKRLNGLQPIKRFLTPTIQFIICFV
jgi:hypothetical protein